MKIKANEKCATTTCWEPAKVAGRCGACYSGFRRLGTQTAVYLRHYYTKTLRLTSRATEVVEERGIKLTRKKAS